jgi:signal peptidase I
MTTMKEQPQAAVIEPPVTDDAPAKGPARKRGESPAKPEPAAETTHPGPKKSVVREYFESAAITVIMALFGMTFITQAVKVPTGSMQNTITIGDHLLVNKFIFGPGPKLPFLPQREIRRGDIMVFKYPGYRHRADSNDLSPNNIPYKTNYVKRVIGVPGDHVRIEGRTVFVNDQPLPEHIITARDPSAEPSILTENDPRRSMPLVIVDDPPRKAGELYDVYYSDKDVDQTKFEFNNVTVPPDSYFVMGDNRNNSLDSRFWGFVPRNLVIGRAMFVYWSYDESGSEGHFLGTRWGRTFKMVK